MSPEPSGEVLAKRLLDVEKSASEDVSTTFSGEKFIARKRRKRAGKGRAGRKKGGTDIFSPAAESPGFGTRGAAWDDGVFHVRRTAAGRQPGAEKEKRERIGSVPAFIASEDEGLLPVVHAAVLHTVAFFGGLAVVEAVEGAYKVTGDAADTLELDIGTDENLVGGGSHIGFAMNHETLLRV